MFSIDCLEIFDDCDESLRKNLSKGKYPFNDRYNWKGNKRAMNPTSFMNNNRDFFGRNINIQAVVGKNGSGKSTLMDLMYMAINNFAYMFERGNVRPGAEPLCFVPKLHVRLYYTIDVGDSQKQNKELKCYLECDDETVTSFCENDDEERALFEIEKNESVIEQKKSKYKGMQDAEIANLTKDFFYTIVSNYSIQSFVYSNYEKRVYFHKGINSKATFNFDYQSNGKYPWINPIFHKNDGYICPIVLNPYRYNGNIDCVKELELSKDRLTALLIYFDQLNRDSKKKVSTFEPYSFNSLEISLKQNYLRDKAISLVEKNSTLKDKIAFRKTYENVYSDETHLLKIINRPLANFIKDVFFLNWDAEVSVMKKRAMLYFQLKIIDIIQKYSDYSKYRDCVRVYYKGKNFVIEVDKNKNKVERMLKKIRGDKSHITKKIRRVLNFLMIPNENEHFLEGKSFQWKKYSDVVRDAYDVASVNHLGDRAYAYILSRNPFTYKKFNGRSLVDPIGIDECLPPSFFSYELILNRDESKKSEPINYYDLSSGELQLLQTLSIHAYHIENILSVEQKEDENKIRPKYGRVNLIFDEIEMTFHPEYQRTFIQRLLDMIVAMRENYDYEKGGLGINIFIITHSPFVLSDIPNGQILYLDNGERAFPKNKFSKDKEDIKTFAGNVSYLLNQSFFMNDFVGEFSKRKIVDDIIHEKNKACKKNLLDIIGDEFLKKCLEIQNDEKEGA